ncbi:hypothetical protein ACFVHS_08365 [Streptomyces sp. NPDC057746]|uniref:hypothetical protein n=1 Tax=Streptomyces sp. NPDC057746 TaxID=3346237 RepID=UPI0036A782E0
MPELTEPADPLHEHLTALPRTAGARAVAPEALRSVFDSCTARPGPSTAYIGTGAPATASDGSGSTSTSRAVALNSATVDALETLTATAATRRPHTRRGTRGDDQEGARCRPDNEPGGDARR